MLNALGAILDFFTSLIQGVVAFIQMLQYGIVTAYSYFAALPLWLSGLMIGIVTILIVRLIIGR